MSAVQNETDQAASSANVRSVAAVSDSEGGAATDGMIRLMILLPTQVLLDVPVVSVIADGEDGAFCLRPRHVDFLSALVPGILSYTDSESRQHYVAVAEGILVKSERTVRVSVRHAVCGDDLAGLRRTVAEQFQQIDERERNAQSAVARLEADFVRRFLQLKSSPGIHV